MFKVFLDFPSHFFYGFDNVVWSLGWGVHPCFKLSSGRGFWNFWLQTWTVFAALSRFWNVEKPFSNSKTLLCLKILNLVHKEYGIENWFWSCAEHFRAMRISFARCRAAEVREASDAKQIYALRRLSEDCKPIWTRTVTRKTHEGSAKHATY